MLDTTMKELLDSFSGKSMQIITNDTKGDLKIDGVESIDFSKGVYDIKYNKNEINAGKIINSFEKAGINIEDIFTKQQKLEEIFLKITNGN